MTVHLSAKNKLYPWHLRYTCSPASCVPNSQNPYRQSVSATYIYLSLFVLIRNVSFEKYHSLKQSLNQKTIDTTNFFRCLLFQHQC